MVCAVLTEWSYLSMFDGVIWLIVELILTYSWYVATSLVQNG